MTSEYLYYAKIVLSNLLLTPGLIIIVLLIAALYWHRWFSRLLVVLTAIIVFLLSTIIGEHWLARSIETYPVLDSASVKTQDIDALVVLLAGRQTAAPEIGKDSIDRYSMDRLVHAVRLHRETDLPVILSGGPNRTDMIPLAVLGAEVLKDLFDIEAFALERDSRNTWENAHRVADLLRQHEFEKVAVITHAWHMKRALYSFSRAGADAVAAPTYYIHREGKLTPNDAIPNINSFHNSTNVLHEYLGLLWYRLTR